MAPDSSNSGASHTRASADHPSSPDEPALPDGNPRPRRQWSPRTLAVHTGRPPRAPGQPANVPPILASAFHAGGDLEYSRHGNPTWQALEEALAALDPAPATSAITFGSGMSAIAAVLDLAAPGTTIVTPSVAYSGTVALLDDLSAAGRVEVVRAAPDAEAIMTAASQALAHRANAQGTPDAAAGIVVWLESPTNPTLDVIDLAATAAGVSHLGAMVVVDSTFATPLGQSALELGAHIEVHSATKYIAGHSDVLLGVAITRDEHLAARLVTRRTLTGGVPSVMGAWLALRGLRTLPLRWERACANAAVLARRCQTHPAVSHVRYPGLTGDPGHALASRQMAAFGAIVGIELAGGAPAADQVVAGTRLWMHATSLGGVESVLERRRRWTQESPDVPEGYVRLSVGIEDVEDLWGDLAGALDSVASG